MRYSEITEAFDAVQPYTWHDLSTGEVQHHQAQFTVDDDLIKVNFTNAYYNPGLWEMLFTRADSIALNGKGRASTVLATVMAIARDFIAEYNPRYIAVAAKNDEASRSSLYPKLAAILMREFPQFTLKNVKKLINWTEFNYERPTQEPKPLPPRAPEPEPKPVTPEEWDDIEAWLNDSQNRA